MTDEKNTQEAKIRHGLSAKRDSASFRTLRDIIIPAGTIMRDGGKENTYSCMVGTEAAGFDAEFTLTVAPGSVSSHMFQKVTAA